MLFPKVPGGFFTLLALACVPWCLRIDRLSGLWTFDVYAFGFFIGILLIVAGADWFGRKYLRPTPSTDGQVKRAITWVFGIAMIMIVLPMFGPTSDLLFWLNLVLRGIGVIIVMIGSALNGSTVNTSSSSTPP